MPSINELIQKMADAAYRAASAACRASVLEDKIDKLEFKLDKAIEEQGNAEAEQDGLKERFKLEIANLSDDAINAKWKELARAIDRAHEKAKKESE